MKVALSSDLYKLAGGPLVFSQRIKEALKDFRDVEIVSPSDHYDIILVIISMPPQLIRPGAKIIQRLDGIYHNLSQNHELLNRPIKEIFEIADGIVYQSHFDKKLVRTFFGDPKIDAKETIIYNGASPKLFSQSGEKIVSKNRYNIITSALWRPHKRLNDLIEGFLYLDNGDIGLIILGDVENRRLHENIHYMGFIDPLELPKFYRSCDLLAHLAWIDHCPNSVVEALVSGLPVICTNNGGTKELVKDSGIVIQSEPEYDFKLCWLYQPPKIDPELIASAIKTILSDKQLYVHDRLDLSIYECAKQYIDFSREVL